MDWKKAQEELGSWHKTKNRNVGNKVLSFLETELRLMIPPLVKRTWPEELLEDTLQNFLLKILEVPLSHNIDNFAGYICRSFKNYCIDVHRDQQRKQKTAREKCLPELRPAGTSAKFSQETAIYQRERRKILHESLKKLDIADRVALKLENSPHWLTDFEIKWLSDRSGKEVSDVRKVINQTNDTYELTLIFDPVKDEMNDRHSRRKRMERFRRRRARARQKLRTFLREVLE